MNTPEYNRKYYARDPERHRARAKAWRAANKERIRASDAEYHSTPKYRAWKKENRRRNREKISTQRKVAYAKNREKENARSRAYKAANKKELALKQAKHNRDFPEGNRFRRSLRRAAEKRATPAWADKQKMLALYAAAVALTRQTGIEHHVDHIYPLQSKTMCGLHCEANLQVIPAIQNQRKKNRAPELSADLPRCCAWPSIVHFASVALN